jgi:hypothetical protein
MSTTKKALSILLIILLVANSFFYAFTKIGNWQFWITLGVLALLAHFLLPKIK